MRTFLRCRIVYFVGIVCVMGSIVAGAAIADPSAPDSAPPVMSVTATHTGLTPGVVNPADTITCNLTIDYPHESSHDPETANVVAHWNCTSAVASLEMDVQLYYGVIEVGTGHSENTLKNSLNGNAAASCSTGTYYGYVQGTVVFPPGYTPSPQYKTNESEAYVTCT